MVYKLHDITLLLVEDVQPMLTVTASVLNIFGFQNVVTARNGREAFTLFQIHKPDLVITDWIMEPESGVDLINKIRTSPSSPDPYVPVILMSGYSDRMHVELARDNGATEFLLKPFTAKDLYGRIAQIIEKPRQFVDVDDFFGPDRRRRRNVPYAGKDKRGLNMPPSDEFEGLDVDLVIRDIRKTLRGDPDKKLS